MSRAPTTTPVGADASAPSTTSDDEFGPEEVALVVTLPPTSFNAVNTPALTLLFGPYDDDATAKATVHGRDWPVSGTVYLRDSRLDVPLLHPTRDIPNLNVLIQQVVHQIVVRRESLSLASVYDAISHALRQLYREPYRRRGPIVTPDALETAIRDQLGPAAEKAIRAYGSLSGMPRRNLELLAAHTDKDGLLQMPKTLATEADLLQLAVAHVVRCLILSPDLKAVDALLQLAGFPEPVRELAELYFHLLGHPDIDVSGTDPGQLKEVQLYELIREWGLASLSAEARPEHWAHIRRHEAPKDDQAMARLLTTLALGWLILNRRPIESELVKTPSRVAEDVTMARLKQDGWKAVITHGVMIIE